MVCGWRSSACFGSVFIDNEEANRSLQKTDQEAQKVGKTLQDTIKIAGQFGAELGQRMSSAGAAISRRALVPLAALTASMTALAKTTADYGDTVAKSSQEVGLSVVAYQELSYALGQNNLDAAEADRLFGRLNQRLGMARQGNEKYRKTIEGLGVSMEALDKGAVSTDEAFMQIIESLSEMQDSQMQAAIAGDMFGTMLSRKMMPMIRGGAEGIEELRKRAHDLGIVMDEEATRKSELFGDTMDDLSRVMGGFNRTIGSELQAPLINIAKWFTDIVAGASKWIRENPKLVRQIVMFGGAIAGVLGVLVTLGTTMIVTGKIIGALGVIFNILTSKPMLIIAAIGLLWVAWDRDWGNIRTKTEEVWEIIEPIFKDIWKWLGKAWMWTIDTAGAAWDWLKNTTWKQKWDDIKKWMSDGWKWAINLVGDGWAWLKEKAPWATSLIETAWQWTLKFLGTAWTWLKETAWPWISKTAKTGWHWTADLAGDVWDWLKDTAWPWLSKTARTTWNWFADLVPSAWVWLRTIAWPWLTNTAWTAWEWTARLAGTVWTWLKETAWPWISETAKTAWEWTASLWGATIAWIKKTAWPWLSKTAKTAWEWSAQLVGDAIAWIKDTAWPWINGTIRTTWEWTVKGLDRLKDLLGIGDKTSKLPRGESGFDSILDAIYKAEGGKRARVPYGMTGFADAGNKFGKVANQQMFMELSEGLTEGSEEYYRAAALTTIQHYWDTFQQRFPGIAGQTFDQLTPEMQQMFITHLGRWFAPPEAHELNLNWVPNVLGMLGHGETAEQFKQGGRNIITSWLDGIYAMAGNVAEAAEYMTGIVADYMVGQSPPSEGPLSDVDEGGANIATAWLEGMEDGIDKGKPGLMSSLERLRGMLGSIWDRVPEDIKAPINQAMDYITALIEKAEEALFSLEGLQEELQQTILGGDPGDEAEGFMARLRAGLEEHLDKLGEPIDRFAGQVAQAAGSLMDVVKAVASGNWVDALLSIIMETESFAKAMELLGAILDPIITLFDNILRPVINGLLNLWNGIIDALASISIFGWKPFAGLKRRKIDTMPDPKDDPDSKPKPGSGGRQVSAITGPTRDLLVDLLTPLANLSAIVGPVQSIRDILDARLPDFGGGLELAGASAGAGGISVNIDQFIVQAPDNSPQSVATASAKMIERLIAEQLAFARRGRGGK